MEQKEKRKFEDYSTILSLLPIIVETILIIIVIDPEYIES